jgi:YHS domain-containing protein
MKTLFTVLAASLALATLAPATEPVNDKCPVCSKTVRLIFHSNVDGKRVAFGSADCKKKFDLAPTKYAVVAKPVTKP